MKRTPCEHLYDIACRELSEVMAQRDELLAALKGLIANDGIELALGGNPNVVGRVLERARAAIAKADVASSEEGTDAGV
jgi:hypothetical protein